MTTMNMWSRQKRNKRSLLSKYIHSRGPMMTQTILLIMTFGNLPLNNKPLRIQTFSNQLTSLDKIKLTQVNLIGDLHTQTMDITKVMDIDNLITIRGLVENSIKRIGMIIEGAWFMIIGSQIQMHGMIKIGIVMEMPRLLTI